METPTEKITAAQNIRLTQYAHGAGCGCKISPLVLKEILGKTTDAIADKNVLVGNGNNDDAAVYKLNETEALISTTDFFSPIVDDALLFGKVAAANALSDVYAMGGTPFMALAVLGWPVEKLPASLAAEVIEGARQKCAEAGIALAGGHSIDSPEPFFGLSVSGKVLQANLKRNNSAKEGDVVLLTKPIGLGILSTAAKREKLLEEHVEIFRNHLLKLNDVGSKLGEMKSVNALTDVTGFGLLGHLIEMADGSGLSVELNYEKIPVLQEARTYLAQNIIPDATYRNWKAYAEKTQLNPGVNALEAFQLLPDPQTNGGLLIAVHVSALDEVTALLREHGYENFCLPIGKFISKENKTVIVC